MEKIYDKVAMLSVCINNVFDPFESISEQYFYQLCVDWM